MFKIAAWAVVIMLAISVGYLGHTVQSESMEIKLLSGSQVQITYPDLITIILTAFGVIIAVASIGLATAAVIGWNSIEGKAMRTATEVLKTDIDNPDGKLQKLIKEAIADNKSPFHQTLKAEISKMMENEMYRGVSGFDVQSNGRD